MTPPQTPLTTRPMSLLLVDDEPQARAKLRRFLDGRPDVCLVGEAGHGEQALALAAATGADAMLLDIQMPGLDGLQTAAALLARCGPQGAPPLVASQRPAPLVAFTTAYDAFAVQAFELNAVDYLLKPITRERLDACLDKLRRQLALPAREQPQRQGLLTALHQLQPVPGHWMVAHRGALQRVALAEVDLVEAEDNYIWLHTERSSWLDRATLASFLAHPAAAGFVRVHRSYAVARERIARIEPLARGDAQLTTAGGRTVRVSRRFREALLGGPMPR